MYVHSGQLGVLYSVSDDWGLNHRDASHRRELGQVSSGDSPARESTAKADILTREKRFVIHPSKRFVKFRCTIES